MQLGWLSDLHLDRADDNALDVFRDELAGIAYDALVITGDIATSRNLEQSLEMIASASRRPVYVILGNHEFEGGSISAVRDTVSTLTRRVRNLQYLGDAGIVALNASTAMIGFDGWADTRAGFVGDPGFPRRPGMRIGDFDDLPFRERIIKMRSLGRESAEMLRASLPHALSHFHHVIIATHVPPFPSLACYDNKPCCPGRMAAFVNLSVGLALIGIARQFPNRRITVLAGHTHHRAEQQITPNLMARVAAAKPGMPTFEDVINLSQRS